MNFPSPSSDLGVQALGGLPCNIWWFRSRRASPLNSFLIEKGVGVISLPGGHKVKKPFSQQTIPWVWIGSRTNEERLAQEVVSPRSPQTPNHSLPWYKVVELVRTEDVLDLFFYFCLVRMQEMGERKKYKWILLSTFSSSCHKCPLATVAWCGFVLHGTLRLDSGALRDGRLKTDETERMSYTMLAL